MNSVPLVRLAAAYSGSVALSRLGVVISAFALAPAALAQDRTDRQVTAEEAFEDYRELYGPPEPEPEVSADCDDPVGDEIVVCAALEEQSQFRVPSRLDRGDNSNLKWDYEPPDVAGPGIFKGKATASGCVKGLTCPPPPAYIFDITALPEAPPGSDADKIAKGEKPAG